MQYWSVCWYFSHLNGIKCQPGISDPVECELTWIHSFLALCNMSIFPSTNPLVAVFALGKRCQIWVIFAKFTWMQMLPTAVSTDRNLLECISILINVAEASKRCYVRCGSTSCYLLASLETGGKEHLEVHGGMCVCFINLKGLPSTGLTCTSLHCTLIKKRNVQKVCICVGSQHTCVYVPVQIQVGMKTGRRAIMY